LIRRIRLIMTKDRISTALQTNTVQVFETFTSIQGESTFAGLPCFFIRLAECNLRCCYCDTMRAWRGGRAIAIAALVKRAKADKAPLVEITGGEPLLQPGFPALARALRDRTGKTVLVETNGSLDISCVPNHVIAIVDIKCPGSGEAESVEWGNVERLRPYDEVKFVIGNRADYKWAKDVTTRCQLWSRCSAVLFSPVLKKLKAGQLAAWILKDRLPVRIQPQLHRLIGMR
jgi:7-carboxy-7-deazaguanine synthase